MSLRRPPPAPAASPHVADGIPPELLVRALSATSEISLITDAAQNILHASRSFSTITGYSEAEVLGTNCRILQGPGTAPEAAGTIRDALARGEQFRGDILNYRKDGSPFWNALTITPLLDENGQVTHFVSVQRDINARMALHEQLRFQATHDQLTGLPNRAALDGHLARALDPDGGSRPAVAVGLIDLDRFKEVNNSLGHEAGDVILKSWAARMQARLQPAEFLARMGGDEFVLVVEGAGGDDAAATLGGVLRRLGRSVDEPFDVGGETISLTMSAGLACSPRDGNDMRTLLRGADAALNVAKARPRERRAGGNWPGTRRTPARLPAPAPAAGAPAGVGAGARTPPSTSLPPTGSSCSTAGWRCSCSRSWTFTPAASTSSSPWPGCGCATAAFYRRQRSSRTSTRRRRTGCSGWDSIRCWPASRPGTGWSCPPRSPSTLRRPACWTRTARVSSKKPSGGTRSPRRGWSWNYWKPRPRTGTCSGAPWTAWSSWASDLAMDDLGAGYSSLKRLSMLPFTAVKIDRDMLTGLRTSPLETLSLIATLVQIGRDFDLSVVAEGLEDLGMTEAVAVLGARYGQGYHLARPMPAAEVPGWTAGFESRESPRQVTTALGALAFHWKFLRLGSPHPHRLQDCPFTDYLESRGGRRGDVHRWHAQQHRADSSSGASRMIVDWLIREIRREA